jgi:hypothetical protein
MFLTVRAAFGKIPVTTLGMPVSKALPNCYRRKT